jgi:hypothetical protein
MSMPPPAEHSLGCRAYRGDILCHLDAASLAATAGMHLRLDDPHLAAQGFSRLDRFVRCGRDAPGGHRDSVAAKHVLRLILVQVH